MNILNTGTFSRAPLKIARGAPTVPRLPPLIACMTSPHEIDEVAPKGVHELEKGWGRNSVQL